MNTIKVIGIDLAKNVFQVCVWMEDGSVASNRKISRQKLLDTVRTFSSGTLIAMEACATSHYWGRTLQAMGFIIRLVPTRYPFCSGQDGGTARYQGTAQCPTLMVEQRTALANQIRAFLAEEGVIVPAGIQKLQQYLPEILYSVVINKFM